MPMKDKLSTSIHASQRMFYEMKSSAMMMIMTQKKAHTVLVVELLDFHLKMLTHIHNRYLY